MANPKMITKPSVGKDRQGVDLFYAADMSIISTTSMINYYYLLKLNICIYCNLAILLLGTQIK